MITRSAIHKFNKFKRSSKEVWLPPGTPQQQKQYLEAAIEYMKIDIKVSEKKLELIRLKQRKKQQKLKVEQVFCEIERQQELEEQQIK